SFLWPHQPLLLALYASRTCSRPICTFCGCGTHTKRGFTPREAAVRADLAVVGKALAAACGEVREGGAGDTVGGGALGEVAGAGGAGEGGGARGAGEARRVVPAFVASPGSTSEAAAVLRVAAEHELAVVPRGSGSRLGWGVPPSRCDLVVDTLR